MEELAGKVLRDPPIAELIEEVRAARKTMVIGASDTGKTTLILTLINELVRESRPCGVLDADMGQSDIGPPTTIGLGGVNGPIESLGEAEVKGIYFVGSISPRGSLLPAVVGTSTMARKAGELGYEHLLINTTGLVRGALGRALKGAKLELVRPDLVIFLQVQAECEPLVQRVSHMPQARVVVMAPSEEVKTKSPGERKENRARSLRSYFSGSTVYSLPLQDLYLEGFPFLSGRRLSSREYDAVEEMLETKILWAEEQEEEIRILTAEPVRPECAHVVGTLAQGSLLHTHASDEFENVLTGLYDAAGECYSLGIIRRMDFVTQHAEVEIAQPYEKPWGMKFSLCRVDSEWGVGTFSGNQAAGPAAQ